MNCTLLLLFSRLGIALLYFLWLGLTAFGVSFGLFLLFLSDLDFRNDGLALGIDLIHFFLGFHALSDIVDSSIDDIDEAFKRVLVEGVDFGQI